MNKTPVPVRTERRPLHINVTYKLSMRRVSAQRSARWMPSGAYRVHFDNDSVGVRVPKWRANTAWQLPVGDEMNGQRSSGFLRPESPLRQDADPMQKLRALLRTVDASVAVSDSLKQACIDAMKSMRDNSVEQWGDFFYAEMSAVASVSQRVALKRREQLLDHVLRYAITELHFVVRRYMRQYGRRSPVRGTLALHAIELGLSTLLITLILVANNFDEQALQFARRFKRDAASNRFIERLLNAVRTAQQLPRNFCASV